MTQTFMFSLSHSLGLSGLQRDSVRRRPKVSVRNQQAERDSDWTGPRSPKDTGS